MMCLSDPVPLLPLTLESLEVTHGAYKRKGIFLTSLETNETLYSTGFVVWVNDLEGSSTPSFLTPRVSCTHVTRWVPVRARREQHEGPGHDSIKDTTPADEQPEAGRAQFLPAN